MREVRLCDVAGCGRKHFADNLCQTHYMRKYRTGNPGTAEIHEKRSRCSIEDCDNPHYAHGYCMKHGGRLKRTGDPLKTLRNPPGEIRICKRPGCDGKHYASGYCKKHYNWWRPKDEDYIPAYARDLD